MGSVSTEYSSSQVSMSTMATDVANNIMVVGPLVNMSDQLNQAAEDPSAANAATLAATVQSAETYYQGLSSSADYGSLCNEFPELSGWLGNVNTAIGNGSLTAGFQVALAPPTDANGTPLPNVGTAVPLTASGGIVTLNNLNASSAPFGLQVTFPANEPCYGPYFDGGSTLSATMSDGIQGAMLNPGVPFQFSNFQNPPTVYFFTYNASSGTITMQKEAPNALNEGPNGTSDFVVKYTPPASGPNFQSTFQGLLKF